MLIAMRRRMGNISKPLELARPTPRARPRYKRFHQEPQTERRIAERDRRIASLKRELDEAGNLIERAWVDTLKKLRLSRQWPIGSRLWHCRRNLEALEANGPDHRTNQGLPAFVELRPQFVVERTHVPVDARDLELTPRSATAILLAADRSLLN